MNYKLCVHCGWVISAKANFCETCLRIQSRPGFIAKTIALMRNVDTYFWIQSIAVITINSIFMNHFNYTTWETLLQAVSLGLFLPGLIRK